MLKPPSLKNHQYKVIVIVNISTNCSIVIIELLSLDSTIPILVIEIAQELHEDLISSHLTALELRVFLNVVNIFEILSINKSITSFVKSEESFIDSSLSFGIELSSDSNQELIETDLSVSVLIEEAEE